MGWCFWRFYCGDVQLDKDNETEYHFYMQLMDDAEINGFGTELFAIVYENNTKEKMYRKSSNN